MEYPTYTNNSVLQLDSVLQHMPDTVHLESQHSCDFSGELNSTLLFLMKNKFYI